MATSGPVTVTSPNELLVAWVTLPANAQQAGPPFTSESAFFGDMVMDAFVLAPGTYSATATVDDGSWLVELATFRVDLTLDAGGPINSSLPRDGGIQFIQGNAATTEGA